MRSCSRGSAINAKASMRGVIGARGLQVAMGVCEVGWLTRAAARRSGTCVLDDSASYISLSIYIYIFTCQTPSILVKSKTGHCSK